MPPSPPLPFLYYFCEMKWRNGIRGSRRAGSKSSALFVCNPSASASLLLAHAAKRGWGPRSRGWLTDMRRPYIHTHFTCARRGWRRTAGRAAPTRQPHAGFFQMRRDARCVTGVSMDRVSCAPDGTLLVSALRITSTSTAIAAKGDRGVSRFKVKLGFSVLALSWNKLQ